MAKRSKVHLLPSRLAVLGALFVLPAACADLLSLDHVSVSEGEDAAQIDVPDVTTGQDAPARATGDDGGVDAHPTPSSDGATFRDGDGDDGDDDDSADAATVVDGIDSVFHCPAIGEPFFYDFSEGGPDARAADGGLCIALEGKAALSATSLPDAGEALAVEVQSTSDYFSGVLVTPPSHYFFDGPMVCTMRVRFDSFPDKITVARFSSPTSGTASSLVTVGGQPSLQFEVGNLGGVETMFRAADVGSILDLGFAGAPGPDDVAVDPFLVGDVDASIVVQLPFAIEFGGIGDVAADAGPLLHILSVQCL